MLISDSLAILLSSAVEEKLLLCSNAWKSFFLALGSCGVLTLKKDQIFTFIVKKMSIPMLSIVQPIEIRHTELVSEQNSILKYDTENGVNASTRVISEP